MPSLAFLPPPSFLNVEIMADVPTATLNHKDFKDESHMQHSQKPSWARTRKDFLKLLIQPRITYLQASFIWEYKLLYHTPM